MTSLPLPATTATSHARSSPPPFERDREAVGEADLVVLLLLAERGTSGTPRYFGTSFATTSIGFSLPSVDDLARDLAADAGDLALERAHAGLAACSGG